MLYEIPRGLDNRLIQWEDGWEEQTKENQKIHFLREAELYFLAISPNKSIDFASSKH